LIKDEPLKLLHEIYAYASGIAVDSISLLAD